MEDSVKTTISISFWGGWGYGWRNQLIRGACKRNWPGATLTSNAVPGGSGCMEVKVTHLGNEHLCWSKLAGDANVCKDNIEEVVKRIRDFIEKSWDEAWPLFGLYTNKNRGRSTGIQLYDEGAYSKLMHAPEKIWVGLAIPGLFV